MKLLLVLLVFGLVIPLNSHPPFPAPGRLVDLGGHRLHVRCTGKGTPAVVVENGLGDFSFDWILVQTKVESFTRICTYDRAGYAWSDPGPKPRTFAQLNLELHDALAKLGERGPFILVGHSFGGGVVRSYAAAYPAEVAGMVLVDIVHEDQRIPIGPKAARVRDFATGRPIPKPRETLLASDKPPVVPPPVNRGNIQPPFTNLPEREQRLRLWAESLPALEDAESSQKDWSSNDLDVPAAELEEERQRLQAQLARLSTHGVQVIVQSGHNMHLESPEAVASAIRTVFDRSVKASRSEAQ